MRVTAESLCEIWRYREGYSGIALYFEEKPTLELRAQLHAAGYWYHHAPNVWVAVETEAALELAGSLNAFDDAFDDSDSLPPDYGVRHHVINYFFWIRHLRVLRSGRKHAHRTVPYDVYAGLLM